MQVCKKHLMNIKMIKIHRFSLSMTATVLLVALSMSNIAQASKSYMQDLDAGIYMGSEILSSLSSGPGQKFAASKNSLTLPLERKNGHVETFSSYFHLDVTEFDWRGSTAAQNEYVWLSMPIQYEQQRGRKNVFMVDLEPGLMTSGGNIGIDYIGLNASLVGRHLWDSGGFWQFGLTVDRAFGDYNVRPVLGVGFQASNRTWVELGFPNINIKHYLSSTLQSYLLIKPAGGLWKEEIKTATTQKVVSLQYRNWQLGVGANFHWRGNVWLNGEFGQLRNRSIRAYDEAVLSVRATPEQSLYWRIGASVKY
ncbi:MAG: hypothetical protein ACI910_002138 [Oleispira sp.]|jgi:hypothetical protein